MADTTVDNVEEMLDALVQAVGVVNELCEQLRGKHIKVEFTVHNTDQHTPASRRIPYPQLAFTATKRLR